MTTTVSSNDVEQVKALLIKLRDEPVDSEGVSEALINKLYTYLMNVPASKTDGVPHWYCNRAEEVTIMAATFLLRLFAYDSPRVDKWKFMLREILATCPNCIRGLQVAKLNSKETCVNLVVFFFL